MIEKGIRELLTGDATVGGMVGTRVRPLIGAQLDVRPFVVFNVTAGESTATHSGPSDYQRASVELGFYADSYLQCVGLSDAAKALLDGKAMTLTTVRIAPAMLEDETDIEATNEPGKDRPVYVRTQTYRVLYRNL
jgi:hypothetical protein